MSSSNINMGYHCEWVSLNLSILFLIATRGQLREETLFLTMWQVNLTLTCATAIGAKTLCNRFWLDPR